MKIISWNGNGKFREKFRYIHQYKADIYVIQVKRNEWPVYCLFHFLSVNINNTFDILGVWTCKPYIDEYYIYQSINMGKFNERTVIIGDFNSNAIWDKKHDIRSHRKVVDE